MKPPALFPPGWLEETSSDPTRAAREIESLCIELVRVQGENSSVRGREDELRREVDRYNTAFRRLHAELESERRATRSSKAARVDAERRLEEYSHLSYMEAKKARDAESALSKEKDRTSSLERRVARLEGAIGKLKAQREASDSGLVSAIKKLAKSPAVGKRLAAACHPDKVPVECNKLAVELFKFVQGVRDANPSQNHAP